MKFVKSQRVNIALKHSERGAFLLKGFAFSMNTSIISPSGTVMSPGNNFPVANDCCFITPGLPTAQNLL